MVASPERSRLTAYTDQGKDEDDEGDEGDNMSANDEGDDMSADDDADEDAVPPPSLSAPHESDPEDQDLQDHEVKTDGPNLDPNEGGSE